MPILSNLVQIDAIEKTALSLIPKPEKPSSKASDKTLKNAQNAMKVAREHFADGHMKGISHLVAALTGVDQKVLLTVADNRHKDTPALKGQAVVIVKRGVGHDFKLERPVFLKGDGNYHGVQFKGDNLEGEEGVTACAGSTPDQRTHWRFATADEIKAEAARLRKVFTDEAAKPAKLPW